MNKSTETVRTALENIRETYSGPQRTKTQMQRIAEEQARVRIWQQINAAVEHAQCAHEQVDAVAAVNARAAEQALDAVLALHYPEEKYGQVVCTECSQLSEDPAVWPCDTFQAASEVTTAMSQ